MNLHEDQTKNVLKRYEILSPIFKVVKNKAEALHAADEMKLDEAIVKIRIHAGGRKKAGGVRVVRTKQEIGGAVDELIGRRWVNNQTGVQGLVSNFVIISPKIELIQEYYLGISIDGNLGGAVLVASKAGGTDVEQGSRKALCLKIENGLLCDYQLRRLAQFLEWKGEICEEGIRIAKALVVCFFSNDATMLEINPLGLAKSGKLLAIDAKMSIDDNALWRQEALAADFDESQLTEQERQARALGVSYVALQGEIGCMVNGAGLAMAVGDLIRIKGAATANFLDIGGIVSEDKIYGGLMIVLSDPNLRAVFISLLGSILDCKQAARGIAKALSKQKKRLPIVIRLDGIYLEEAEKILSDLGCFVFCPGDLNVAVQKTIEAAGGSWQS